MASKIEVPQGNTLRVDVDLDTDITGATVWFTAKTNYTDNDSAAVMRQQVTVHDTPLEGLTHFLFGPSAGGDQETMTSIDVGSYVYDIKVKYSDDTEESWPPGKLKIKKVVKQGDS